jgi:hypothetical protein
VNFEGKVLAVMLAAAAGAGLAVVVRHRCGVEVSVTNDEAWTVRGVEVLTTAGAYPLGDVAPGASASTLVGTSGESSVSVAWLDARGERRELDADVYFEGSPEGTGYGGTVEFVFADGTVRSEEDVEPVLGILSRGTPPKPDPRRRSR